MRASTKVFGLALAGATIATACSGDSRPHLTVGEFNNTGQSVANISRVVFGFKDGLLVADQHAPISVGQLVCDATGKTLETTGIVSGLEGYVPDETEREKLSADIRSYICGPILNGLGVKVINTTNDLSFDSCSSTTAELSCDTPQIGFTVTDKDQAVKAVNGDTVQGRMITFRPLQDQTPTTKAV